MKTRFSPNHFAIFGYEGRVILGVGTWTKKLFLFTIRCDQVVGVDQIKAHIEYLSNDQLEGRRAGSNGEKLAMQYIADQFKKIGLSAKGSQDYFYNGVHEHVAGICCCRIRKGTINDVISGCVCIKITEPETGSQGKCS